MSVIVTECVVHDAQQARRYQSMNLDEAPPKQRVNFTFHLRDVKSLTQHRLDEGDETGLDELTIVDFYDGMSKPITMDFIEISKLYKEYNEKQDKLFEDKLTRD